MRQTFADLSLDTLRRLVELSERGVVPEHWESMSVALSPDEQQRAQQITTYLLNYQLSLMNEATIWSRAIYPLLLLAETALVQAWAQVPLRAVFSRFSLEGLADGVLGSTLAGTIDAPYLTVVEAKRGLEAQNPQYQLYGTMLAAAWNNQQRMPRDVQEIYGCYTIGDGWTFVHGVVRNIESDLPSFTIRFSREYAERLEILTILQILKFIVHHARALQ